MNILEDMEELKNKLKDLNGGQREIKMAYRIATQKGITNKDEDLFYETYSRNSWEFYKIKKRKQKLTKGLWLKQVKYQYPKDM